VTRRGREGGANARLHVLACKALDEEVRWGSGLEGVRKGQKAQGRMVYEGRQCTVACARMLFRTSVALNPLSARDLKGRQFKWSSEISWVAS
jgi:hypothetical protein